MLNRCWPLKNTPKLDKKHLLAKDSSESSNKGYCPSLRRYPCDSKMLNIYRLLDKYFVFSFSEPLKLITLAQNIFV